ncbi:MAG: DEAD/DEAH box helicase [Ignisphaera sp.]|nr:DEAD/DEAH box helicase [Ignisphaera sp.]MCX8168463.1 DEAD/DEAH box helicase [Ignisphaera sp.]MDW8085097.1 DEAD/DEAH box helicase [Ignisphaera sp.]
MNLYGSREEAIMNVFRKLGFNRLTQIQQHSISKIIDSEIDVVVSAPTGSGKTEAVIVPLFLKISHQRPAEKGILAIYITPLRALNRDLAGRIRNIASIFNLSVDVWHGDTSYHLRRKIMENPPSVLLTTPESLQVLLVKHEFRELLKHLYAIVVDELQEIISSERGSELIVSLERIDSLLGKHVRRIAISSPVKDIDTVAKHLFNYRRFEVVSAPVPKQYSIEVLLSDRTYQEGSFDTNFAIEIVRDLIHANNQVLIFANTRVTAEEIGFALGRAFNLNSNVGVHHGSLSRDLREHTERMFKKGEIKIAVSTSSLELGIDVGGIDFVVQYLSPRQAIKLLQRIGRAGHREEDVSRGAIVVPPIVTELIESVIIAKRAMNRTLEPINIHTEPLDVLAHQVIGMAIERGSIKLEDVHGILTGTSIFSSLTTEKLKSVIDFLTSINLLKCRNYECSPTKRGLLYYLTTNMIPDTNHVEARSILNNEVIGILDEDFVATCNEDDILILAGRAWKIEDIELANRVVWLSPPSASDTAILPKWVGDNIPVHRNVAREVCSFIRRFCDCSTDYCLERLRNEYSINDDVEQFLKENRERFCRVHPRDDVFVVELHNSGELNRSIVAFYHCLGTKGSEAFSLAISNIFRNVLGVNTSYRAHQIGSVILTGTQIKPSDVIKVLQSLCQYANNKSLKEVVSAELINTSIFKKRLIEVAKRFGVISKDSDLSEVKRIASTLFNIPILSDEALRELFVEKIDIKSLEKFLEEIAIRKRKIKIISTLKASPFLLEISSLGSIGHIVKQSIMPREMLVEIAKRRLIHNNVRMLCSLCYNVITVNISEYINKCHNIFECHVTCQKCGSRALVMIDDKPVDVVKNVLDKLKNVIDASKLNPEEKNLAERVGKEINFIMESGIAGIIALRGRGIGIETAKRVLAKSNDLDSLIYNVVEQEKIFLRTHKYWSSK